MKPFLHGVALCLALIVQALPSCARPIVNIHIVCTSDIHGNYLHYDYLENRPAQGGLARVATFIGQVREDRGKERTLLLDLGDILQGQPAAYYYNNHDIVSTHLAADALNYLQYDAGVPGNHDIETGHSVYDRWTRQCKHPIVCANVIDTRTGRPCWKPYTIVERCGVRIALIGLLTPAVPKWLPEELWSGLAFQDMATAARQWMDSVRTKEHPDIIIGMFHSGTGNPYDNGSSIEHASMQVARTVPGFNIVFCGHDHRPVSESVRNTAGKTVLVLNPGTGGNKVAVAEISLYPKRKGCKVIRMDGGLVDMKEYEPDPQYCKHFNRQHEAVLAYTDKPIATLDTTISSRDAFFGSSAFVDFIHGMQLRLSGAEISFAAPLTFDTSLRAGILRIRDVFRLYRYENRLYTLRLTGREIRNYLEKSYDGWVRTMTNPADTMLRFRPNPLSYAEGWQRLATPSYNFDSAAGLIYTVDLSGKLGSRIRIERLADGRPFCEDSIYTVALNSYRANGGGDLLTLGAGISKEQIPVRTVAVTPRDLRYYLIEQLSAPADVLPTARILHPAPLNHWHFLPESWVSQAKQREQSILFP